MDTKIRDNGIRDDDKAIVALWELFPAMGRGELSSIRCDRGGSIVLL